MTKYYFDTSVLLPILIMQHETHLLCRDCLKEVLLAGGTAFTATHTYAEMYRHLTRNRPPYDLPPESASRALIGSLSKVVEFTLLENAVYEAAIRRCEALNLTGAIIYDALHYQAALSAGAEVIFTDNIKDFNRLRRDGETIRIEGIR